LLVGPAISLPLRSVRQGESAAANPSGRLLRTCLHRRTVGSDAPEPLGLGFLEQLKGLVDGPPVIERLDVVGSYNLFGTQREESAVR
jgi:hypothetical protein